LIDKKSQMPPKSCKHDHLQDLGGMLGGSPLFSDSLWCLCL